MVKVRGNPLTFYLFDDVDMLGGTNCVYNNKVVLGNATRDDLGDIWRNSPQLLYMREHYECMGLMKEKGEK